MILIDEIARSDIEYKDEVLKLSELAGDYLNTFEWCEKIVKGWVVNDFGYILCIFYFEIETNRDSEADDHIWVIIGDLPTAYIDLISATTSKEALVHYCDLMEDWINCIKNGQTVEDCYPISALPTLEHANMLQSRIELIKTDYIPIVSNQKMR